MKKIIVFALLFLLVVFASAWAQNGALSAKDLEGLSTQNKLLLMQMAEDSLIRKDAVKRIQYEEAARNVINRAVDVALGKNNPANPQQGIKIIIDSSLDGQTKLETIKLIKEVTGGPAEIFLSGVENKLSDIDMKLSRIARALGNYEDTIFVTPNLRSGMETLAR